MRIPWIGHLVLFMHEGSGLSIVLTIIILLVIVEFVIPLIRKKREIKLEHQN